MSGPAYLFELTIEAGKLDEFKAKAEGYTEAVRKDEADTLEYQWWIAEDGSRCLLKETFTSSEALLQHLANVGPSLPDLLAIAPITRFEVFGEVSDAARAELDGLGANYFAHHTGFDR